VTKKRIIHSIELIRRSPTRQLHADFFAPYFCAGDKYMMHTYQASVRAKVNGRSQVIKTEIRAMNAQDARWLLWAQYGFHSIQAGPHLLKAT
jgi:hypothetical protein